MHSTLRRPSCWRAMVRSLQPQMTSVHSAWPLQASMPLATCHSGTQSSLMTPWTSRGEGEFGSSAVRQSSHLISPTTGSCIRSPPAADGGLQCKGTCAPGCWASRPAWQPGSIVPSRLCRGLLPGQTLRGQQFTAAPPPSPALSQQHAQMQQPPVLEPHMEHQQAATQQQQAAPPQVAANPLKRPSESSGGRVIGNKKVRCPSC